ncbi:YfaP family protein [Undibacterium sp. Di26W]|uniref:YfaP family protein n=1 Tax=Undibacterium sp. Di26W TaxID=3413035 RepID=UPI003BF0E524
MIKLKFTRLAVVAVGTAVGTTVAMLSATSAFAADVNVDAPRGGWRHSGGESSPFTQPVHYPASSVNTEGQNEMALIKGRINGNIKKGPGKLIVNGVGMPLSVGAAGEFARPYSFSSGSNNVEVRSPDGSDVKRVQFFDTNTSRPLTRLRVVLSWDSDGTDLDLHVISPDGQHVFYGNRVVANGGALDVDVTTGYGPEIYANTAPIKGTYHVYVNYYGSGGNDKDLTIAKVAIISQEGTLSEKQQSFQVPMRKAGELTLIKSFTYP